MKIIATFLIVAGGLLSGCIVAEPQNRGEHRGEYRGDRDRDGIPNRADRDRDGDGIANRADRRPDDPRRY